MNRRALEGVVVILAMGRRAVDQRRPGSIDPGFIAKGGAISPTAAQSRLRADHGNHIIEIAGGNAKPGVIQQRRIDGFPHLVRNGGGLQPGGPAAKMLRDGDFGQ